MPDQPSPHPDPAAREAATRWAREALADPAAVVLDTETTGLTDTYAVQIAVVTIDGDVLLDTLLNPGVPIPAEASAVHGITDADAANAPIFAEVLPWLSEVLHGRRVLAYNAPYHLGVLARELNRHHHGDPMPGFAWLAELGGTDDVMRRYAEWRGDQDDAGSYTRHALGGPHTARGDCLALLARIHEMAGHAAPEPGATPAEGTSTGITYTHPDVFTRGVAEGWADPTTDPTRIDWAHRQQSAAIDFEVIDGRPVNPFGPTGIHHGRNELGHWGEQLCADAIVTAHTEDGHRWLLMIQRDDGHGWAVPGGYVDPGEDPMDAAYRELAEETSLTPPIGPGTRTMTARYVPDPRASDEAWMVTAPTLVDLGTVPRLPAVTGSDDATVAAWIPADTYDTAVTYLRSAHHGHIFAAHQSMLRSLLD